jgi:hypothetical protein
MTRHTLDLQGKRDEEKGKEEEMESAYLDWRKRWRCSPPAAAGWRRNRSRESPTAAAQSWWSRGEAEAEVVTTNGKKKKKDPRDTYGHRQRKSVSVTGVIVSGAPFVFFVASREGPMGHAFFFPLSKACV